MTLGNAETVVSALIGESLRTILGYDGKNWLGGLAVPTTDLTVDEQNNELENLSRNELEELRNRETRQTAIDNIDNELEKRREQEQEQESEEPQEPEEPEQPEPEPEEEPVQEEESVGEQ